jgi:catalase
MEMDGAQQTLVERILDALVLPGENPDKFRSVHTIGVGATGFFTASDVASQYCVAKHFNGRRYPVTVRFSNGLGSAERHDDWADVRGMATRFHLADDVAPDRLDRLSIENATDLIAMTLPEFFTRTPEAFLDFLNEAKPVPVQREPWWRKVFDRLQLKDPYPEPDPGQKLTPVPGAIAYAGRVAESQVAVMNAALMAKIGAPASYARATYHAVHAFGLTDPDGVRRWVRFAWRPVAGVLNIDPAKRKGDVYLKEELRERFVRDPARFSLMMSIGEPGDDPTDSSRPWPPHRTRVVMGELALDSLADDGLTEKISFNPWLLAKGMEPSGDPVLRARRDAYALSSKRRGGACPFSGGASHAGR